MPYKPQETIYAFDFDGVICDSAVETSITGWKAAQSIWTDMSALPSTLPSQQLINDFRKIRPLLETGYEAILIMRLLHLGKQVTELCESYEPLINELVQQEALQTDYLKKLFGETRDRWIVENEQEWLTMNPLFPNVMEKLHTLTDSSWYIITTKQERFVKLILQANKIHIEDDQVFGMDRQMSKQDTLLMLKQRHPDQSILFIEDRLQTLQGIIENKELKTISLQLVSWGYNTQEDREVALDSGKKSLLIFIQLEIK